MTTKEKEYCSTICGYKNYQTWNVSLWLFNDEHLYSAAVKFMEDYKGARPYAAFIRRMGMAKQRTPDRIKWLSTLIDHTALDKEMRELKK